MCNHHRPLSPPTRISLLVFCILLLGGGVRATAQVMELRRVFEQFSNWKVQVGADALGPVTSQLDPTARTQVAFNSRVDFNGLVSVDYWQVRAGVKINSTAMVSPFVFWNPVIKKGFGGDSSRWSASLGWEGAFSSDDDFNPLGNFQADNSIYSPANSFSLLIGYWFGPKLSNSEEKAIAIRAYPTLDEKGVERWMSARVDTNFWGRGLVDTNNYRSAPYDTNTYVRGAVAPNDIPIGTPVRYTSREGFSASVGLATGKYAGSGPVSRLFNVFYPSNSELQDTSGVFHAGLNPVASLRYRYSDYIAQLDLAGEDINFALIARTFENFDIELGVKYLEHLSPRSSRGEIRPQFFLGVRYAPAIATGSSLYEHGEHLYAGDEDSDSDGIPDEIERELTFTDPTLADSDGDGLTDGLEIYSYKTNPSEADSDGDGLADGIELLTEGRRTDPLRGDTDGDGLNDGEEIERGTDPLDPAGGERGR